jgi:hypothetical protein
MCGRYTAAKDFGELIKLIGMVMARVSLVMLPQALRRTRPVLPPRRSCLALDDADFLDVIEGEEGLAQGVVCRNRQSTVSRSRSHF